jgi:alpha-beta hydrolase superfamily lysophospholipase
MQTSIQNDPTSAICQSSTVNAEAFSVITEDGLELKGHLHLLPKPAATVYIVHGFSEHQGRYAYLIQQLLAADFQVITYDHRGHGLSGGKPGCTPKFQSLIQDLLLVLQQTRAHTLNTPNFIYAHSMGGGITLNTVLTQTLPITLTGVIGSSPWLQVTTPPSALKLLAGQITRKLLPQLTMSSGIKPGALTHNTELEAEYFSDPLVHQQISSELFFGTQEAGKQTLSKANLWPVPMLLMHGDMDPVTAFQSSVQFYQHAPKQLVEFKNWPGALHETHQELNRNEVIAYALQWMNKIINNTSVKI